MLYSHVALLCVRKSRKRARPSNTRPHACGIYMYSNVIPRLMLLARCCWLQNVVRVRIGWTRDHNLPSSMAGALGQGRGPGWRRCAIWENITAVERLSTTSGFWQLLIASTSGTRHAKNVFIIKHVATYSPLSKYMYMTHCMGLCCDSIRTGHWILNDKNIVFSDDNLIYAHAYIVYIAGDEWSWQISRFAWAVSCTKSLITKLWSLTFNRITHIKSGDQISCTT